MAKKFDVVTCASGGELLAQLDTLKPDLILMDVDMPELDGYETCHQVRQRGLTLPIIFVTSHQSLDEHLAAYDAGGNDLITKPVDAEILLRKASLAILQKFEKEQLAQTAKSMQDMAMSFLSNAGENSVLLNFVRKGAGAKSYTEFAQHLVDAVSEFDVKCNVALRHSDGETLLTSHGEPNHLELSIMGSMSDMGRIVEFQRQFIVNYNQVSVMICSASTDSADKIGRIRDNVAILAETAEALCENVSMRIHSIARAEQMQVAIMAAASAVESLRSNHQQLLMDTRILLQELLDNVESTYSWLSISQAQEATISSSMNVSIEKILTLLSTENRFDEEINKVQNALNVENNDNSCALF
jgi:CheY-like chemotaxis protein